MSTVFEAELFETVNVEDLSPSTPQKFAVKFLQPHVMRELHRLGLDPLQIFVREAVALGRMMERQPPSEFVVGFYGCGHADVTVGDGAETRLPWMAIELVDGAGKGATLAARVDHAGKNGLDPVRIQRLAGGIIEGTSALHGERIIHRDLKPENVLIAGSIDAEIPKLADCGIARVDGFAGTIGGMTLAYGALEQTLSTAGHRNPLIGPWTDVHALAAVIWFMLAGEDWCRGSGDVGWQRGERRSLRTSQSTHPILRADGPLLDALDSVLARGAAHRLPAEAMDLPDVSSHVALARNLYPSMFKGPERYPSVDAFAADLMPLLAQAASSWTLRAARENRPATAFRPTELHLSPGSQIPSTGVTEIPPPPPDNPALAGVSAPIVPGSVVFQPDGKFLARFGPDLVYTVGSRQLRVVVPPEHRDAVASSCWVTRGPGGGYALVGPEHLLTIRASRFARLPLPSRPGGDEVGQVVAVIEHGGTFALVTAETDESGGPELWTTTDGLRWSPPALLPLGGEVRSLSYGPYGFLVVGARRNSRGRALQVGFDGHSTVFSSGVNERGPLIAALCGAGREMWVVGAGFLLSLDRSGVQLEEEDPLSLADPVQLALDPVGIPWLLCRHRLLRRHPTTSRIGWVPCYQRDPQAPPLVAIGFSSSGVRVVDALGGGALVTPHDLASWAPGA